MVGECVSKKGYLSQLPLARPNLKKISNRMKKSLMSLVVISYSLKSLKFSYADGCVSVRYFLKNNLISFLSTRFQFLYSKYSTSILQLLVLDFL
jgi:hypothetical protein